MPRIEKTVFISYRRKDISWALLVYQHLTANGYDVFFDYISIHSGDFEQIILSNIKARAHFLVILTPSALDRCNEPGDWLRREIETAIDEKRNVIPLFFDDFSFGTSSISKKLVGKFGKIKRYNGLKVPSGYFDAAMEILRNQYLNVALDAVLHPISDEVHKIVKEQQIAANHAFLQKLEAEEKPEKKRAKERQWKFAQIAIGGISILALACLIFGGPYIYQKLFVPEEPTPIETVQMVISTDTFVPQATATDIPVELGIGSAKVSEKDGMVMVYVPAGEFEMGSEDGKDDEKPVHTVYLNSYWIDQTEVTNEMFIDFINETDYITDAERAGQSYVLRGALGTTSGADWRHPVGSDSDITAIMEHPAIHVSWNDANHYCSWAGRRLPTEAEWEKAAGWDEEKRQKYIYPWGNSFDSMLLNSCDNNCSIDGGVNNVNDGFANTAPVGSYQSGASFYGVLDMAGNVMEWVADRYSETYYQYSPTFNPLGPNSGQYRVVRGGAWSNDYKFVRSTNRAPFTPTPPNDYLGFRCSQSAALGIGSMMVSEKDAMPMVYVPAGEFEMGSEIGEASEKPVHTVYLDAYWIDQTEVTNAMYAKCVQVGRCSLPDLSSSHTRESYFGNAEFDDYPVVYINWHNAELYCEWVGRRLPTEAEWEKAAGWDDFKQQKYIYPWGNSVNCTLANFGGEDVGCIGDTTKVGSYLNGKSPYGALDMAGNIIEWVNDWYDENYYGISPSSNPSGPDSGQYRVFRSGSWDQSSEWSVRVTWRGFYNPLWAAYNDGIRCALSASE